MLRPRTAVSALVCCLGLLTTGCTAGPQRPALSPDDTVRAAQQMLVEQCLTRRGLTPPRPGERPPDTARAQQVADAYFGSGRTELSLTLPGGHTVSQHTDGCLAAAQRRLYGDQERWFRASTSVNNLKAKAAPRDRAAFRELREQAIGRAAAILDGVAYP